jgi:hypothetical protein
MLSNRAAFNASVRHVKVTVTLAERIQSGENLADILNEMLDEKSITNDEVLSLVAMLIADKFAYSAASKNLSGVENDLLSIEKTVKSWNAFDLVVVYQHPDVGVVVINPKNPQHLSRVDRLNKCEHIAAYAGCFGKEHDTELSKKAVDTLIQLFEGAKTKIDPAFLKGKCSYKYKAPKAAASDIPAAPAKKAKAAPAKAPAKSASKKSVQIGNAMLDHETHAASAKSAGSPVKAAAPAIKPGARMTPMYAVTVANELFHNGNVEAWKRIIESYKAKHSDLDVLVYYDGERIANLNALFKWGKVKHGSVIQFAVTGDNICDVAKLQRYLSQGASSMFEAFLRGPINGVLSLF